MLGGDMLAIIFGAFLSAAAHPGAAEMSARGLAAAAQPAEQNPAGP